MDADETYSWTDEKKMTGGMKEMYGSVAKRVVLYRDVSVSFPSSNLFREVKCFNYLITDSV